MKLGNRNNQIEHSTRSGQSAEGMSRAQRRRVMAVMRLAHRVLGIRRKKLGLGTLGLAAATATCVAFQANVASAALVSACTGVSLPRSVVTNILDPIVSPLSVLVPGLPAVWSGIAGGSPITLNVLDTSGNVVSPSADCDTVADTFSLKNPKGISIGGNKITGLGNGTAASAGEMNSIAFGNGAATNAAALNSVAIGPNAAIGAGGTNSVALGNGASATTANSVVLGNASKDRAATTETGVTLGGNAYIFAGQGSAANGVVSVGSAGKERQVINVAAGKIASDSTDAVNGSQLFATNTAVNTLSTTVTNLGNDALKWNTALGAYSAAHGASPTSKITNVTAGTLNAASTDAVNGSQLYATNQTINNIQNGGGIKYFHASSVRPDSSATGLDSIAVGPEAIASGDDSIAIGMRGASIQAQATAQSAIAIGSAAQATGVLSLALGNNTFAVGKDSVAIGDTARAVGQDGIAIGRSSRASQLESVALGYAANANTQSTALGTAAQANGVGSIAISAAPNSFFNTGTVSSGTNSIAIGMQTTAAAANAITFGNKAQATAAADTSIAIGNAATTSASKTVAIGNAAKAGGAQAIAMGDGAQATGAQSISIGTGNVVSGNNSGAIGDPTTITGSGTYTVGNNNGTVSANNAGAFGNDNTLTGDSSRIVGNGNSVTTVDTFVVGNGVTTTQDNSVVLGNGSSDRAATTETGVTLNGTPYTFAGQGSAANGVVSVGSADKERQVINVAAGRVASGSTDAINGSQLHSTNLALEDLADSAVQYDQNPDGTTNYNSVTLGGPVSSDGGVTGGTTITNVHQGAVNATSTDAINGSQLFSGLAAATTEVAAGTNVAGVTRTTDPTDGHAIYTVDADGTTVSAGSTAVKVTAGAKDANNVTDYAVDLSDATKDKLDNAVQYDDASHTNITLGGAGGTKITNVKDGDVSAGSTDAVNGSQLFATNQVVNNLANDALLWDSSLGAFNANHGGTGPNKITNVAAGDLSATSTDAVNGSQLFAAAAAATTEVAAGTNVGVTKTSDPTDGHAIYTVDANGTTVSAGSTDVSVTAGTPDANNVTDYAVDLSAATKTKLDNAVQYDDATHDSVTLGGAGGTKITNVKDGDLSAGSTDAVNGSQLFATNQVVNNLANDALLWDSSLGAYNANHGGTGPNKITNVAAGDLSATSTDAVNGSQLFAAAAAATSEVAAGTNVAGVTKTNDPVDGHAIYTVDADGASVSAGSTAVKVTAGTPDANNVTDYAVDLSAATKTKLDNAVQYDDATHDSVTLGGAGGTKITNVKEGDLSAGSTDAVNGSQLFATNQVVNSLVNDSLLWDSALGAYSANHGGTGPNRISNVANGVAPNDAVNVSQLNAAAAAAATEVKAGTNVASVDKTTDSDGHAIYTVNANGSKVSAGSTAVSVTPTGPDADNVTDYKVDLSDATKEKLDNAVQYDGPAHDTVTLDGAGGTKITNVKDGDVSAGSTDAVNGSQLFATNQTVTNLDNRVTNVEGDVTKILNGTAGLVQQNGGAPGNGDLTVGKDTGGTVVDFTGTDGARKLTGVADGDVSAASKDAVNGSQLYAVQQTAGAGWNISAQGANETNVAPGGKVDLKNTDGNIVVSKTTGSNDVNFDLAPTVNVDTAVNVGGAAGSSLTADGLTTNGGTGPSVKSSGIDAAGLKITNVKAGSDPNDAVNVSQLTGALDGLGGGATVNPDGTVTGPTYNIAGNTYNNVGDALAAQDKLAVKYVPDAGGNPTNTVRLTGDGTGSPVAITNVAAGVNDTDAVNYSQIKNNISYDTNPDGSRGNSLTLVGGAVGPVTIHNVAAGVLDSDAANVGQIKQARQDAFDYTDMKVTDLKNALSGEARGGIASAMAAAGLRYDDRPGKASVAAALGGFKGSTSVAAGLGYTTEEGDWRLNGAVGYSFNSRDISWNAGLSFTFN